MMSKNKLKVLNKPIVVTIFLAILTAIVAPYLIERTKSNISKQEQIQQMQFEVVENLCRLSFQYYVIAQFVKLDFYMGQPNEELLNKHLEDYDSIAEQTIREYLIEAYRARMYLNDSNLYYRLNEVWLSMLGVDGRIYFFLNQQRNTPSPKDSKSVANWLEVEELLGNFKKDSEKVLEELYIRIGR